MHEMSNEHELDDEILAHAAGGGGKQIDKTVVPPHPDPVFDMSAVPTVGNFSQHYLDNVQ